MSPLTPKPSKLTYCRTVFTEYLELHYQTLPNYPIMLVAKDLELHVFLLIIISNKFDKHNSKIGSN